MLAKSVNDLTEEVQVTNDVLLIVKCNSFH